MRGVTLATLLFATAASAAPIPPPRQRPRPTLVGSWVASWGGAEWPTTFLRSGGYIAERPGGPLYLGQWKLRGNVLTIEEQHVSREGRGPLNSYRFTLLPGRLESRCGGLRLTRAR